MQNTRGSSLTSADDTAASSLARREFLQACVLLAAALAGCRTLGANTRLAAELLDEPHPDQWRPVLDALCKSILPFEDPRFPVSPHAVRERLLGYFPIEHDTDFTPLRQALVLFDDPSLFPERLALFIDDEREQLTARGGLSDAAIASAIETRLAAEAASFSAFRKMAGHDRFVSMALADQRAYLKLWSQSALTVRRRFYRSAKVLVMISAYSMAPTWKAIGYDGPLLGRI